VAINVKLDEKMVEEAVRLGNFKTKQEALNVALSEFVARRNRLRILELGGKIQFRPELDYKKMRGCIR
jgi:Arc/MetJ family transcription regulator